MYPSVESYLARLPRGIDSYASAQIKGVVVREAIEKAGVEHSIDFAQVPDVVARLFRTPPAVNTWVPEVHYGALAASIYDVRFRHLGGMPAYEQWVLDRNRRIYASTAYRILFMVVTPERSFLGATHRWAAFHRGSIMTVVEQRTRFARSRLTYPSHLFADQLLRGFCSSYTATGEASGGKNLRVRLDEESDTSSVYTWEWG